jgi:hypothetical protein
MFKIYKKNFNSFNLQYTLFLQKKSFCHFSEAHQVTQLEVSFLGMTNVMELNSLADKSEILIVFSLKQ